METIKVRVTKASLPSYWYAKEIGVVFNVIDYSKTQFILNEFGHYLEKTDCEIVEPSLNDRFEPLTTRGWKFHISEEFNGKYWGRVKRNSNFDLDILDSESWSLNGNSECFSNSNLIPRKSPETIALEKRKAELQTELTEIENKLKEK